MMIKHFHSPSEVEILVVDDTPDNLRLLSNIYKEYGYRVRTASSGKRALETCNEKLPDLILLDILMPDMDGYEVCQRLKANNTTSHIPVIFISALNEVFDKVTAFSVGGIDYVTKPFYAEEVILRSKVHLDHHALVMKLREANRELNAFSHTVAHDLKTPIGNIMSSISLLQMDLGHEHFKEELKEILPILFSSSEKAMSIINELLLLATIRKEDIRLSKLNTQAIVERVQRRLHKLILEKGGNINYPTSWPVAMGYEPWIEEVWVNYLSNALKYGGKPPQIALGTSFSEDESEIIFWIKDNGEGIPESEKAKLYTEFYQTDQMRSEGHGLGLSIVKRIVEKLGGRVGLESAPGQGSQFFFTLKAG